MQLCRAHGRLQRYGAHTDLGSEQRQSPCHYPRRRAWRVDGSRSTLVAVAQVARVSGTAAEGVRGDHRAMVPEDRSICLQVATLLAQRSPFGQLPVWAMRARLADGWRREPSGGCRIAVRRPPSVVGSAPPVLPMRRPPVTASVTVGEVAPSWGRRSAHASRHASRHASNMG